MSDNERQMAICVEETLASGRTVVFAYRVDGGPTCCWDAASLPPSWLKHSAWHPSRVAVGTWDAAEGNAASLPLLQDSPEESLVAWMARTYEYMIPLLGFRGCALSSSSLFLGQIVENLIHLQVDARVLEVGGNEAVGALCSSIGCLGWAVDPAFPAANAHHPGQVLQQRGIAESLPFPSASFDAVISLFVLEHLINPRTAMREMARVLQPGGVLLLGIPVAQILVGTPPLFHRWRFVFDGPVAAERTVPLVEITDAETELTPFGPGTWQPIARESEACLFELRKASHG